jgi:hypothetical protein
MQVKIKQNWANGFWWVQPACDRSRLVLRADERDNGMMNNEAVAELAGREWLQAFLHGAHPADAWHLIEVPVQHRLNQRASAIMTADSAR